jgi:hypothetical protein
VLATGAMDVAMVAAGVLGGSAFRSDRLGPDMIGRWAAGLLRGRWRRADISREPAQRGELALGLATHYVTGVALTQAFLLAPPRWRGTRGFLAGTVYGISTAVLPLLMMFPSMGYGWLGLRSGEAGRLNRIMLVGHIAAMPDTSPPKWIYTNVTTIRANTDRILALLEEQRLTSAGEPPSPQGL